MLALEETRLKIGVIGLGETGMQIVSRLLRRTCHDLYVYDPDGRSCQKAARLCNTAAQVCDACGVVFLALDTQNGQLALLNGVSEFLHPGSMVADFTPVSPAQAHKNANIFRRADIGYLDCGIFSPGGQIQEPFLCFVGGSGETFSRLNPLLRCVAPDCRHMGPSGRGQAVRMLCLSLAAGIERELEDAAQLAGTLGIPRDYFMDSIRVFESVAQPLAALTGDRPAFSAGELEEGRRIAGEIGRRAKAFQSIENE